jgi:hypothetical protein
MRTRLSIFFVMLSLGLATVSSQNRSEPLVLDGGTLIDGRGGPPIADAVVVIEGSRIVAAGPRGSVRIPANAKTISTRDKFIIPGLIDAHVHYWDWNAELFLNHGVTSIVDMGNFSDYMLALSESIEKGWDVGPRIFPAGEFLRGPKQVADSLQASSFPKTAEDARAKVRELVGKGMKLIKVMQDMPLDHVRAVVDEAHKFNVRVVGHAENVAESIEAGLEEVVHDMNLPSSAIKDPARQQAYRAGAVACPPSLMDAEGMDGLIALMLKRDIRYNPTFVTRYKMFSRHAREHEQSEQELFATNSLQYVPLDGREGIASSYHRLRDQRRSSKVREAGFTWMDEFKAEDLENYRECYAKTQDFLRRFVSGGGKVLSGTDTPSTSVPGAGLLHEMEMEAEAGMTPMQVLQATTFNTADFFRFKDVGSVEVGKFADLVILNADPLKDIANVQEIERVIKGGKVLDRVYHKAFDPIIKRPMGRTVYLMPELYRPSTFIRRGLIYDMKPAMVTEGSPTVAIEVDGIGFSGSSVVRIANSRVETEYVSAERLRATIPARLLQVAGTYPITVESPPPGGGISNDYGLIVRFK